MRSEANNGHNRWGTKAVAITIAALGVFGVSACGETTANNSPNSPAGSSSTNPENNTGDSVDVKFPELTEKKLKEITGVDSIDEAVSRWNNWDATQYGDKGLFIDPLADAANGNPNGLNDTMVSYRQLLAEWNAGIYFISTLKEYESSFSEHRSEWIAKSLGEQSPIDDINIEKGLLYLIGRSIININSGKMKLKSHYDCITLSEDAAPLTDHPGKTNSRLYPVGTMFTIKGNYPLACPGDPEIEKIFDFMRETTTLQRDLIKERFSGSFKMYGEFIYAINHGEDPTANKIIEESR